eukprot:CAMPEP_0175977674 /NCGR_PEP_ID=MMETSP0108-20121206/45211_1 /TAXON_ID=195067 ORGANISM="Goniomonas pacifica, Strain CCMP1869" /NCGR_SAMPLE_ID=MMETSP0108 /ASSEMBLY_ACC=CAM_ASM_000204 /LENGTH=37 /DNA_ID= /DNA_START= /DNA_END= /DNA_ORIENTATION=
MKQSVAPIRNPGHERHDSTALVRVLALQAKGKLRHNP